jgi:hypothetical protein
MSHPEKIRVAILGSTGSIGESTLNVIDRHPERFDVVVLAANRSVDLLERQAVRHRPRRVVVADEDAYEDCRENGTEWTGGRDALLEAVGHRDGPAHTELKLTRNGPRIIESHNRQGGDRIQARGRFRQASRVLDIPDDPDPIGLALTWRSKPGLGLSRSLRSSGRRPRTASDPT